MTARTHLFSRCGFPCRKPRPTPHKVLRSVLLSAVFGLGALSVSQSPSAQELFIGDVSDNSVKLFNGSSGTFRDTFVGGGSAGLTGPAGMIFTDNELVVVNQNVNLNISGEILRFDGKSGMFLGKLVASSDRNAPFAPRGIVRGGPKSDFFVADIGNQFGTCASQGNVKEYTASGAFVGNLDRSAFSREFHPRGVVFGPDGLLYVSAVGCLNPGDPLFDNLAGYVLRFDARTSKFVDVFASTTSVPDLHRPEGLVFDRAGHLWVTSFRATANDSDKILELDGKTGALLDKLVLSTPPAPRAYAQAILFGPGDRLFIPISGGDASTAGQLRRCDTKSKACDVVVPAAAQLQAPWYLIFKNSSPTTLDFGGN